MLLAVFVKNSGVTSDVHTALENIEAMQWVKLGFHLLVVIGLVVGFFWLRQTNQKHEQFMARQDRILDRQEQTSKAILEIARTRTVLDQPVRQELKTAVTEVKIAAEAVKEAVDGTKSGLLKPPNPQRGEKT